MGAAIPPPDEPDGTPDPERDSLEAMLGPRPTRGYFIRSGVAFAATVACAVVFDWQAGDIAWGLWISSLCIGYVTVIAALLFEEIPLRRTEDKGGNALFFIGFMLVFTLHFGLFHVLHSFALNKLLPLDAGHSDVPNFFLLLGRSLWRYWPLVLLNLFYRMGDLRRLNTAPGSHDAIAKPYVNVVRLHLMIAAVAILNEMGVRWLALVPVLLGCFFPWGMVIRHIIERAGKTRDRLLEKAAAKELEDLKEFEAATDAEADQDG